MRRSCLQSSTVRREFLKAAFASSLYLAALAMKNLMGISFYALPRTGMRLHSSKAAFRTAVAGLPVGRGIKPDREDASGIGDLLAGRDVVMETAMNLAAAGEN